MLALPVLLAACVDAPERDPSQWPIARNDLEREIPTDDPAELVYRTNCLACHGVDGRGAGGSTGANFAAPDGPLRRPDSELLVSIRDGKRGEIGFMPPHGAILDEAQIRAVLAFVRRRFGPDIVPVEPDAGEAEQAPTPPEAQAPTVAPPGE
jgi:mono/diheme cytochrome c family protein